LRLTLISFLKRLGKLNGRIKLNSIYPEEFADVLYTKIRRLEKLIGYKIKDPTFYIKALTHRSFSEFTDYHLRSNERLEYLGDSVLGLVIAEYLFKDFPNEDEGFLTKTRSQIVNRVALANAAEKINLIDYMLVSSSFTSYSSKGVQSVVSNAIEALIGAIYLDKGLDAAQKFIQKAIINPSIKDKLFLVDKNYKSQLLEFTQAHKLENPVYKLIKEEGPHHNKEFTIEVIIENINYGVGVGKSKKNAEQNAAQDALMKIGDLKTKALQ
jgi:ribonuclease-3